MNRKAFTIVELLIVMAIIGLIAALFIPAIGRAQEGGRKSQCASNLRQIGIAMHIYVDDNNFDFPPFSDNDTKWFHHLEPYLDDRDIFKCLTYRKHDYNDFTFTHFSYGFNYEGLNNGGPPYVGIDIDSVRMTAQCIMVSDGGQQIGDSEDISRYSISKTHIPSPRHLNNINILFVDGHVKAYRILDIPVSGGISQLWWNY